MRTHMHTLNACIHSRTQTQHTHFASQSILSHLTWSPNFQGQFIVVVAYEGNITKDGTIIADVTCVAKVVLRCSYHLCPQLGALGVPTWFWTHRWGDCKCMVSAVKPYKVREWKFCEEHFYPYLLTESLAITYTRTCIHAHKHTIWFLTFAEQFTRSLQLWTHRKSLRAVGLLKLHSQRQMSLFYGMNFQWKQHPFAVHIKTITLAIIQHKYLKPVTVKVSDKAIWSALWSSLLHTQSYPKVRVQVFCYYLQGLIKFLYLWTKNMHCIHGILGVQTIALFFLFYFFLPANALCFLSGFVPSSFP